MNHNQHSTQKKKHKKNKRAREKVFVFAIKF